MDAKREATERLKQYALRQEGLKNTAEEIKRLEDDLTRIRSASTDSTPIRGGGSTREDALINDIALREELGWALQNNRAWLSIMDKALGKLDPEDRLILDYFYIHRAKGNPDRLCEELHLERSQVYDRKRTALHRFTQLLYGVTET